MPRLQRIRAAGFPQHIVQRGNNREDCFFAEADYVTYLRWLDRAARAYGVVLHAYVLMPDHVHLLATPTLEGGISRMMQYLGRHYVQHINKTYDRSGTLWARRYHASVVESEAYLLTLYRFIELDPVRKGLAQEPEHYQWSSAKDHLSGSESSLILDHESYIRLGDSREARALAYRALMCEPLDERMRSQICAAVLQDGVLGSDQFKDRIEMQLGRRVRPGKRGRKPKRPGERATSAAPGVEARPLVFALLSLAPALSQPGQTAARNSRKIRSDSGY